MNKINKLIKGTVLAIVTIVAMVFATSSVMAFQGFSVGIVGIDATFDTTGREEEGRAEEDRGADRYDINITQVSKDITFPSLFVEYSMGNTLAMTVGVEYMHGNHTIGDKSRSDTPANVEVAAQDTQDYQAKAEVENLTTLYFEPGIMANEYFGIYLKGGISHTRVNSLESLKTSVYGNKDIIGGMYGIGLKGVSPWGIFLKLEATKTQWETITLESSTGNKNLIKAKPEQESVRLAIGYNF